MDRTHGVAARALVSGTAALLASLGSMTPQQSGRLALRQAVRDASSDRLVAIVASHPDDQWMVPAAYLRFRHGFRVAIVLATRGEGGQNITGPEVGDALGRLRTLEARASAERLDCRIHHLERPDAGFCRTGKEALELWGRDDTIADLARLLRSVRPDVVMTTHGPDESHGHDQALLEILVPAVELANDERAALDELPASRIARLFIGAGEGRSDLQLPTDTIDPERGRTYRQLAYEALQLHRSQAPFEPLELALDPEVRLVGIPIGNAPLVPSLNAGLPSVFDEARELETLRRDLEVALPDLVGDPRGLRTLALSLRSRLLALTAEGRERVARRLEALERVVRHSVALHATIDAPTRSAAVPGEPMPITVAVHYVRDLVRDVEVRARSGATLAVERAVEAGGSTRIEATLATDPTRGDRAPLGLWIDYTVRDADERPVSLSFLLDVPIELRPAVELAVFPSAVLVPEGRDTVDFAVRVRRNTTRPIDELLAVRAELGVRPDPISHEVAMSIETLRQYGFRLHLPPSATTMRTRVRLGAWATELPVHRVAVRIDQGLRVGLIRGVDDTAWSILRGLGADLVDLTESVLPTRELSDLDTIVVDIRALRSHDAARAGFNRLVEFASAGGRLVVFYHKDAEFNVESSGFRGFPPELPLHIGKGRVTREDQPVRVLVEDHTLLTHPNRIRPSDWDGWVQERGLYFPDDWGDGYEALLGMADPGQPEERGSLLYGRVGDGEFVYCALSLYRQLKNLHPGACRLFANLISRPAR